MDLIRTINWQQSAVDRCEMASEKSARLPVKEFRTRESIFATISKDKHVKSVQHFVVAVYVVVFLKTAIRELHNGDESTQLGLALIAETFKDIHIAAALWLCLLAIHFLLYVAWRIWLVHSESHNVLWHTFWGCVAFCAFFGTFHYAAKLCLSLGLAIGCRCIVLAEQTRLIMKGYAFLRSAGEDYLVQGKRATFAQFLYFSFAPTLVYRSTYPRTSTRSWTVIFKSAILVAICMHFVSLLETEHFIKLLGDFGKRPFGVGDVVYILLSSSLPAFVCKILLLQVVILFAVQNAFGELLRFGDRQFFKDWWTQSDMNKFYLNWNTLIQDWLYNYVYRDVYTFATLRKKTIARAAVFAFSIAMHEVLVVYILEITMPVYMFSMLVSIFFMLTACTEGKHNIAMLGVLLGTGSCYTFPHLEHFAKINCPNATEDLVYVPKLISCYS